MSARVLVAGIGNIFFGDDGFGPEVVRQLPADGLGTEVRAVDYGIRGMHLAYDLLDDWDALVLVDALPDRGAPGEVAVLEIGPDDVPASQMDAHAMDPATVVACLRAMGGTLPRTLLVGCQAANVEEGIGLSPPVHAAVEVAVARVQQLVGSLAAAPSGLAAGPSEEGVA